MRLVPLGEMAIDMNIYYGRYNDRFRKTGKKVRAVRHTADVADASGAAEWIIFVGHEGAVCDEYL